MLSDSASSTAVVDKGIEKIYDDFECPDRNATDFTNRHVRRAFLQKIFMVLMFQFLCIFGFVTLCLCVLSQTEMADQSPNLVFTTTVVIVFLVFFMTCFENARRKVPYNRFYLVTFTFAESLLMASVALHFNAYTALIATGIKALYSLALALFSVQSKYQFNFGRAVIVLFIVCCLLSGAAAIFCHVYLVETITAGSCALLVFCFFMFDINIMLNENSLGSREHVFAILNLYVMLYVMRVIGACIVGNWLIIVLFL